MTDLEAFIARLPKAELHVHQVGSASPRIVADLRGDIRAKCRVTLTILLGSSYSRTSLTSSRFTSPSSS